MSSFFSYTDFAHYFYEKPRERVGELALYRKQ